jgi:hypothetical protein
MAAAAAMACLAAACATPGHARVAAKGDDSTTTSTTTTTSPPVTVTTPTLPVTTSTLPVRRSTTTTTRPRVTTTTTAKTAGGWLSPLEPGSTGWGYGGYGAHRITTQDDMRLDFGIYMRDGWDGENDYIQVTAELDGPRLVTHVHFDLGDGTTSEPNGYYSCDDSVWPGKRPDPIYYQTSPLAHYYKAAGDYRVTVSVTTVHCSTNDSSAQQTDPVTLTDELTFHQHTGTPPPH